MTASNISHALCAEVVWVAELVEGFNPFLEFSTNLLLWFINIISGCGAAFLFHSLLRKLETVIQFSCLPIAELKVLCISYELNQFAGFLLHSIRNIFDTIKTTSAETYLTRLHFKCWWRWKRQSARWAAFCKNYNKALHNTPNQKTP